MKLSVKMMLFLSLAFLPLILCLPILYPFVDSCINAEMTWEEAQVKWGAVDSTMYSK